LIDSVKAVRNLLLYQCLQVILGKDAILLG